MTELYTLERGDAPLIISIPHLGTHIPEELRHQYTDIALTVADTDWHLDRLYSFAKSLGATILGARISRYVIDLNRPPNDESLYPGQTTTSLCPTETFRGE
ncbi:N-formylglutamate amidohydrolase, partial [Caballeronia sp. BR00000012568055]|uniref:N-formylglutamate amidohydrolase n=1 Tax=Caballeronia sp. BR00000012568055 TaxID=2918761 RepID=UPI0023F95224